MAEFVQSRIEKMLPEMEQMEKLKLFNRDEIQIIIKRRKEYEYKIQRHTKCKEDYLRYIHYEMDMMKLVKQRRAKFGIEHKKSDIDYSIANRINKLYKQAMFRFQGDIRFWVAHIKFCKQVKFQNCVSRTISRMINVHQDKPKCWHIAAQWEIEENKNIRNARQFLIRGLHLHPNCQLLLTDLFKLELDEALSNEEDSNSKENAPKQVEEDVPTKLKRAFIVYEEARKNTKDIKFILKLINILKVYKNVDPLETKLISDMVKEYSHEPLMWDIMARRELAPSHSFIHEETVMEIDSSDQTSLRDRLSTCNDVYQTALRKLKVEEMWSLYLDFLIEINADTTSLPNYKRKLLKTALAEAHSAGKLSEKYYIHWIDMLSSDSNSQKKMYEVLCFATNSLPESQILWERKFKYSLLFDTEEAAAEILSKATQVLGEKSFPLWKLKLLHLQATAPEKCDAFFQESLKAGFEVARNMIPLYLEHTALIKSIQAARKLYESLYKQPPSCLELHKKMIELELLQQDIILKNARRPFELATLHFGKTNIDVWMDYVKFEMKHGDPLKVGNIRNRAVQTLESSKCTDFIEQCTLMDTELIYFND